MTRLVVHIQFLLYVIDLRPLIGANCVGHIPLGDLAIDEQGGVGIAPTIKRRVQGAKAQLGFGHHRIPWLFEFAGKPVVELGGGDHRHRRGQLAVGNEVLAVRRSVQAVRALRHRDVARQLGTVSAVEHRYFGIPQGGEFPVLDGLFDARDVEHHRPVTLVAHRAGSRPPRSYSRWNRHRSPCSRHRCCRDCRRRPPARRPPWSRHPPR